MPNYCDNNLTIKGARNEVEKFLIDFADSNGNFSMEQILPLPSNTIEDTYSWFKNNWGTKWDLIDCTSTLSDFIIQEEKEDEEDDIDDLDIFINSVIEKDSLKRNLKQDNTPNYEATIHYFTAWSPNERFFELISTKYPNLEFILEYFEGGLGFIGESSFKNGARFENEYIEYGDNEVEYYVSAIKREFEDIEYFIDNAQDYDKETIIGICEAFNHEIPKCYRETIHINDIKKDSTMPDVED